VKHIPCSLPLSSFAQAPSQPRLFDASESACIAKPQAAARAAGAGLVPYKTTLDSTRDSLVNLSPSACAERRVNRLKRSVWASGHLHGLSENGFRASIPWFVTLTYAKANTWAGDHLGAAVQGFRNWCKSRKVPCRYTWVAEIQPRRLERLGEAVVHYHLLAWLPVGVRMPMWDRRTANARGGERKAFWSHGMTQREVAKSGVGYLMKYLSKLGELTRFPRGLRVYGIGGLNETGRSVRRWFNLPEWVKSSFGVGEVVRRKFGLLVQRTGEILEPAYSVRVVCGGLLVHSLRAIPQSFHSGAYSSVSFS
jgi:hypothetical protein